MHHASARRVGRAPAVISIPESHESCLVPGEGEGRDRDRRSKPLVPASPGTYVRHPATWSPNLVMETGAGEQAGTGPGTNNYDCLVRAVRRRPERVVHGRRVHDHDRRRRNHPPPTPDAPRGAGRRHPRNRPPGKCRRFPRRRPQAFSHRRLFTRIYTSAC